MTHYLKNRERILAERKAAYKENPEKFLRQCRQRRIDNPEQAKAANRKYYLANKERINIRQREYVLAHPEQTKRNQRAWETKNRTKINLQNRERKLSNPSVRLAANMRSRVSIALRGSQKADHTFELVGCSLSDLRKHLESKFVSGMTWENYGPVWQVDHIRPCISFDLINPAQQRECFHFTNLQPLFAFDNRSKRAKYNKE